MERLGKALGRATSKRKGKKSGPLGEVEEVVQSRSINFSKEETDILLEAAQEIQKRHGLHNINFKKHEMQEVYVCFSSKSKGIRRKPEVLAGRLKTLKREYNTLRELATKSGWGWDYVNHVIVPPTPEVLQELIKSEPRRLMYFKDKKFPWYAMMTELCGGIMAHGDRRGGTFNTQNTVGTHNSGTASGTGSSDDPRDDNTLVDNETEDTVQQPFSQPGDEAGASLRHVATSSEDAIPTSRSSGSQKRKSTDDSIQLSKGQKIQKKISSKSIVLQQMAETGNKLVMVNEQLVEESRRFNKRRDDKEHELDKALAKLNNLSLQPLQFNVVLQKIEDPVQRRFFLNATEQQIWDWIAFVPPHPGFNPHFTTRILSSAWIQSSTWNKFTQPATRKPIF